MKSLKVVVEGDQRMTGTKERASKGCSGNCAQCMRQKTRGKSSK